LVWPKVFFFTFYNNLSGQLKFRKYFFYKRQKMTRFAHWSQYAKWLFFSFTWCVNIDTVCETVREGRYHGAPCAKCLFRALHVNYMAILYFNFRRPQSSKNHLFLYSYFDVVEKMLFATRARNTLVISTIFLTRLRLVKKISSRSPK